MKLWLINNETILECGAMKNNRSNKCRNCFPFVAIEIENSDELGWHFIIVLAAKVIQLLFIFSDFQSPPTKNIKAKVKFQADREYVSTFCQVLAHTEISKKSESWMFS